MCSLGKPTMIRWEVDPSVPGSHNMIATYCNGKCIQTPQGGENMVIGVSHYCENDQCKVELFTVTIDEVADSKTNCPGCGQFGRTKGREPKREPVAQDDPHS